MDGCQGSLQEQWHPDYHQEGYFEVTAQGKRLFPTTMAQSGCRVNTKQHLQHGGHECECEIE